MTVGALSFLLEETLQLKNLFVHKFTSIFASYFEGWAPRIVTREEEVVPGASLQHSPDQLGAEFRPMFQVFVIDKSEFQFWCGFLFFWCVVFFV